MVNADKKASANGDKPKRKVLTPQEKIDKLKAELAAAELKATEKDRKAVTTLKAQREKIVTRITADTAKVETIDTEIAQAEARIAADTPAGDNSADTQS